LQQPRLPQLGQAGRTCTEAGDAQLLDQHFEVLDHRITAEHRGL